MSPTARTRRIAAVASLVDFRLRRRGTDAAFVYEPEIVEPRLAAAARGVDVVIAGPPCQGHSNLNKQTRWDDVPNALYLTVPAFAVAVRARMAIVENVPEVTSDRSPVVETARRLFESAGYSVEEGILNAEAMGWPQTRRRHFLVARIDAAPIPIREVSRALAEARPRPVWWARMPIGSGGWRSCGRTSNAIGATTVNSRRQVGWRSDSGSMRNRRPWRIRSSATCAIVACASDSYSHPSSSPRDSGSGRRKPTEPSAARLVPAFRRSTVSLSARVRSGGLSQRRAFRH